MGNQLRLYKYKTIEMNLHEIQESQKAKNDSEWDRVFHCIKHNHVWFSNIESLNDPFEFAFKAHLNGVTWDMDYKGIRKDFNDKVVVFSACAVKNNPLLWALYANKYSGLAFEFICHLKEDQFYPVSYTKEPYSMEVEDLLPGRSIESDKAKEFMKECLCRKSKPWEHEQEYRALRYQGPGHYNLNQPHAISKVILGHKVSDEMTHFICNEINALNASDRPHSPIQIEKCRISESGWDIEFEHLKL